MPGRGQARPKTIEHICYKCVQKNMSSVARPKITLEAALALLIELVNTNPIITVPSDSRNKGIVGHLVETALGLCHTSDCLDFTNGELKAFPLKVLQNGTIKPKETVAITMVTTPSLELPFNEHRVAKKIQRVLFLPYLRTGDSATLKMPFIFEFASNSKAAQLESDYNQIVKSFNETGRFQSSVGKYLQTRTKGAKGSDTRAFYFRTNFLEEEYLLHNPPSQ